MSTDKYIDLFIKQLEARIEALENVLLELAFPEARPEEINRTELQKLLRKHKIVVI